MSSKKMPVETKLWLRSSREWCKTQKISIASCDDIIRQAKKEIELLKKRIVQERRERSAKVAQLKRTQNQIRKYK